MTIPKRVIQHGEKKCHTSSRIKVSARIMTVSRMAYAQDHTVRTLLKCTENKHRIDPAGARYPDDLDIGRVGQAAASRQIRTRVAAPVAAERYYFRSEFFASLYRHIASTSARICLFEKPCRSMAPDGHVTVHAPQPWQSAVFTCAIRRTSRIP